MNLQDMHDRRLLRVKYAITSDDDLTQYISSAPNYQTIWTKLPDGWTTIEQGTVVPQVNMGPHTARLISTPAGDIVAVEHETGLEIVAVSASVVSAAAAVVALFQTWRSNRRTQAGTTPGMNQGRDAIVIETRNEQPDGVVVSKTTTIPAHLVTTEAVTRLMSSGTG